MRPLLDLFKWHNPHLKVLDLVLWILKHFLKVNILRVEGSVITNQLYFFNLKNWISSQYGHANFFKHILHDYWNGFTTWIEIIKPKLWLCILQKENLFLNACSKKRFSQLHTMFFNTHTKQFGISLESRTKNMTTHPVIYPLPWFIAGGYWGAITSKKLYNIFTTIFVATYFRSAINKKSFVAFWLLQLLVH